MTVEASASLKEAAELLVRHGVSGLPVVERGHVVGVFSERDLLVKEQGPESRASRLFWLLDPAASSDRAKLEASTVGEAMTSPAVTTDPLAHVAVAARLMLAAGVARLPVLDRGGSLAGIVSRADLVRAFVRTDEEIEREIQTDVIESGLWLDDASVQVDVHDGEVVVSARGTTRFDEELARKLIARVPGVVSVNTQVQLV